MHVFFYKNKKKLYLMKRKTQYNVYVFKIDKFCVMNNWRNISWMTLQTWIKIYVQKHKPVVIIINLVLYWIFNRVFQR